MLIKDSHQHLTEVTKEKSHTLIGVALLFYRVDTVQSVFEYPVAVKQFLWIGVAQEIASAAVAVIACETFDACAHDIFMIHAALQVNAAAFHIIV